MLKPTAVRTALMTMIIVAASAVHASPAQATTQTAPNVTPATLTVAGQTFNDAALAPDGTWFVGTNAGLLAFPRTQAGGLGASAAPVTWSDPVTSTSRSVADAVAVRPDGRQIAVAFAPSPNDTAIIAVYDLPLSDAAPVRVLRGPSSGALEDIRSMAWDATGNLYALGWIYDSPTWWWGVSVFAPSTGENDPPARIIGERRTWRWSAITVDGSRDLIIGHATTFDGLASGYLRVPLGLEAQDPVDRLAGPVGRFVTTADGTLFNLSGDTLTAWDAGARWTQAPLLTVSGMPTGTFSALGVPSTGSSLEVLTYSGTALARYTYPITSSGDSRESIVLPVTQPAAPSVTLGDITGQPLTGARLQVAVTSATGSPEPSGIITWQSSSSADDSEPWTTIDGVSGNWYEPSASDAGKYVRASITLTNTEGTAEATTTAVGPIRPAVVGSRTQLYEPHATAVDSRGRVYAANHTRAVTVHAQAGNVAPVATLDAPDGAGSPLGISVDSQDRVWVAYNNCTIARYPALGASPAAQIAWDRSWQVPLLAAHPDFPWNSGCRGVVPTADGSAFWASNADIGTLGRFSATGPSGTLVPDRILSGLVNTDTYQGPWGLTLDPAGNVVVASDTRVLAVTPNAGFVPQEDQTSADWATWQPSWTAWEITGLVNAQAAVRRADGSTVIAAQGSPTDPFLQVLAPGVANGANPQWSLTTSSSLPFTQLAGFSVSADGTTAIVPSKTSALILPISLSDGSVPATWLQGSAVGQSGGYLRSITTRPSEPEPSPSPPSPSETPATTPSAPAAGTSPTVASAPAANATAQAPAAPVPGPASSGAAPNASPSMSTQVQRIQTSSSTSPSTAPVVRTLGRAPLALSIVDFPAGSTVRTTLRRPSGNAVVRQVRVGTDGTLQLPTKRLSRPGRYLVTLTDDAGTRRYVAIVVQRPGRR